MSVVGPSCIGDVKWEIFSCISLYETVYSESYFVWFKNV